MSQYKIRCLHVKQVDSFSQLYMFEYCFCHTVHKTAFSAFCLKRVNFTIAHFIYRVSELHSNYLFKSLSSAEAPVSKHQRKKLERERWREKTGARGTMGRGKRREPLPDNVFKMAPDFRGRLGLVISFINTEQDGGTFTATTAGSFLSFRATVSIDERKQ